MAGKSTSKIMDTQITAGDMNSIPKPGEAGNGVVTVINKRDHPIVVTAMNAFFGQISSAIILPGESVAMPTAACAAVDLYCWHCEFSGVNWEGTYPVFVQHYHEAQYTIWVGGTAVFGAKAAAGAAK